MSRESIGMVLGGLAPALILGAFSTLVKASTRSSISIGPFLISMSVTVLAFGVAMVATGSHRLASVQSISYAAAAGLAWAVAQALIMIALTRYGTPVSKLVPLFNMNTLVAVGLGLLLYREWENVNTIQLMVGAVLIVAGGILVARA